MRGELFEERFRESPNEARCLDSSRNVWRVEVSGTRVAISNESSAVCNLSAPLGSTSCAASIITSFRSADGSTSALNSGLVAGLHPSGGPVLGDGDGLSLSCEQRPEIVPASVSG